MLCCRPKSDEYELEEEGDKKLKEKKKSGNQKPNSDLNGVCEDIESPVEIKVTEAEPKLELSLNKAENQPESEIKGDDSKQSPDEKGDNSQFASQLSFTSQSSVREDIYRSREKFFTGNYPIDESLSQGDRKSVSSTDERFAAHQSKIRASLVQPVVSAIQKVSKEDEMSAEEMKAVVNRLENVAQRLESLALNTPKAAGGSGSGPEAVAPFVSAYDEILKGNFAQYLELSNKIGGEVQAQANLVNNAFKTARDFLAVASKSKKPSQTDLQTVVKPISDQIGEIQQFRESNRTSKLFNHLSAISESIPALGWVVVEPTPNPFVKDMKDAGIFYTNRVLKDYKGKDGGDVHCDWTKAWNGTLTDMMDYIKQYHTTGVSWNPQGGDAKSVSVKSAPAPGGVPPPPPPGGAPPPPPPPPPVEDVAPASGGDGTDAARAQLFADLNKGSAITSGLKKVTDDMKTHKNPALRAQAPSGVRSGPAPFKAANTGPKTAPKPSAPATKPPVFELQEKKWIVEHQIGNKNLVISDTNLKQVVYIYKCVDSLITVKGKVNSINIDSCKKVSVLLDDVVSSVEFVNSQSVKAQVTGKCPTASIDKTDGCMLYLSKDSLDAEIITAKSSEMNILVPNPKDESDFLEFPLPEQFKSTWNGKKFTTECTESI